jgi:hypothetical protein
MKLPPIATACLSALAIDSCSNVIAQRLKAWNESKSFVFDSVLFTQFAIMVVIMAPINYHWQNWLERAFPGWKTEKQTRVLGEGEEEKGIMLRESGEGRSVVEEEVRVRNWWNIFRKWFTDVSWYGALDTELGADDIAVYHYGRIAKPVRISNVDRPYEGQNRCIDSAGFQKCDYTSRHTWICELTIV